MDGYGSKGWNSITCLWHAAMLNNAVNIDSNCGVENGWWRRSQVVSMFSPTNIRSAASNSIFKTRKFCWPNCVEGLIIRPQPFTTYPNEKYRPQSVYKFLAIWLPPVCCQFAVCVCLCVFGFGPKWNFVS